MKGQNVENHKRVYPAHHLIFYPIVIIAAIVSSIFIFTRHTEWLIWLALTGVFLLMAFLSFMMRQHYALINQDRTVRLELRLRYYTLTQKRFEPFEYKLSLRQLVALRFASDEELVPLLNRATQENLTPSEIKKLIKNWQADHMRV